MREWKIGGAGRCVVPHTINWTRCIVNVTQSSSEFINGGTLHHTPAALPVTFSLDSSRSSWPDAQEVLTCDWLIGCLQQWITEEVELFIRTIWMVSDDSCAKMMVINHKRCSWGDCRCVNRTWRKGDEWSGWMWTLKTRGWSKRQIVWNSVCTCHSFICFSRST